MSEFVDEILSATSEDEIRKACEQMKAVVVESYPQTPNSRRLPMADIRKEIRVRFPAKPVEGEVKAEFPYYFTNRGKGHIDRLEHLAIKYLSEEWNTKRGLESVEENQEQESESVEEKPVLTTEVSLESFGLSEDELAAVKNAIGEADVKEWLKQAILQRANAINKLRESLDEDWASIPSVPLMEEKRYRTNSAACRELVSRAVRVVKRWNHDHPEQKWCITNKLISELTGITVKAIAKAVEGMDNESYNRGQGLEPVINRLTRAAVGEPSKVMSIAKVTGIEGSEVDYKPE